MTILPRLPDDALTQVKAYLLHLQQEICNTLESIDKKTPFTTDHWQRESGGEGRSCVLENGQVFEKAGVNFSHVFGDKLPSAAIENRPELNHCSYHAMGVSLVIHPDNPFIPTSHANVRFFVAQSDHHVYWWFGGGFDLTPYYGFIEDCIHWHKTAQSACQPFGEAIYPRFKTNCDRYFYLPHRKEARGIGGLFFDDYHEKSFEHSFNLMQSIGNHYIKAYAPIVQRRMHLLFTKREKKFQLYRRGRYAEFNLIYDRGTLFGLQSEGRTESILMSMPPKATWIYNWSPEKGSPEEKLYTDFLPVRDWA